MVSEEHNLQFIQLLPITLLASWSPSFHPIESLGYHACFPHPHDCRSVSDVSIDQQPLHGPHHCCSLLKFVFPCSHERQIRIEIYTQIFVVSCGANSDVAIPKGDPACCSCALAGEGHGFRLQISIVTVRCFSIQNAWRMSNCLCSPSFLVEIKTTSSANIRQLILRIQRIPEEASRYCIEGFRKIDEAAVQRPTPQFHGFNDHFKQEDVICTAKLPPKPCLCSVPFLQLEAPEFDFHALGHDLVKYAIYHNCLIVISHQGVSPLVQRYRNAVSPCWW